MDRGPVFGWEYKVRDTGVPRTCESGHGSWTTGNTSLPPTGLPSVVDCPRGDSASFTPGFLPSQHHDEERPEVKEVEIPWG